MYVYMPSLPYEATPPFDLAESPSMTASARNTDGTLLVCQFVHMHKLLQQHEATPRFDLAQSTSTTAHTWHTDGTLLHTSPVGSVGGTRSRRAATADDVLLPRPSAATLL
jgi:hypothetical protein